MVFDLDYKSRMPIYEQLYESITRFAALGAIAPNEQLPSVRSLAQELGVNPNTVQKAYQMLERDGVICSIPGKGSFLAKEETALQRRRHTAVLRLRDSVRSAKECGVKKDEVIDVVDACYEGKDGIS